MYAFSNLPVSDCTAAASLRGASSADHRVSVDKHLVGESIRERVCGGMGGAPQAGKTCIIKAVDYSQFDAAFPTTCADRFNEMPLFEVVDRSGGRTGQARHPAAGRPEAASEQGT